MPNTETKKAVALTAIITAALGLWLGYRLGYGAGESNGYVDGEWAVVNSKSDDPLAKRASIASILRLEKVAGHNYL